ncbi:MAG: hypothetical protein JXA14_13885 [Anaerolineae bacterium]|nr:hypothetical protein [Anaerolineae bacterium]
MSEVIGVTCGNCGAPLNAEGVQAKVVCPYCGTESFLEGLVAEEISVPVDQAQIEDLRDQLEQAIQERSVVKIAHNKRMRTINEQKQLEMGQVYRRSLWEWGSAVAMFLGFLAGFLYLYMRGSRELEPIASCNFVFIFLCVILYVVSRVQAFRFKKQREARIAAIHEKHQQELNELEMSTATSLREIEQKISLLNQQLHDLRSGSD